MCDVGRVIVGAGGSPGSLPALRYAMSVARRHDARLVPVHAWVPPGGELAARKGPSPHLSQLWREAARQRLQDALESAWAGVPGGLDVQPLVVRGEPGAALVDIACCSDDLLVVGAGRRRGLARIWHGRVSRYCLAHSRCPVLTVPPPALAGEAARTWSFRRRELTVDQAVREWESAS